MRISVVSQLPPRELHGIELDFDRGQARIFDDNVFPDRTQAVPGHIRSARELVVGQVVDMVYFGRPAEAIRHSAPLGYDVLTNVPAVSSSIGRFVVTDVALRRRLEDGNSHSARVTLAEIAGVDSEGYPVGMGCERTYCASDLSLEPHRGDNGQPVSWSTSRLLTAVYCEDAL